MKDRELEARLAMMEKKITKLEDIEAIRKLENAYGYYLNNFMNQELIDCFSKRDDTALDWPQGTLLGEAGVKRFFGNINKDNNPEFMHQMMQISDYITVNPDGVTAKGRWWGYGAMALPRPGGVMQNFTCGIYENQFIKEDGVWKIWKITWVPVYSATPHEGWVDPSRVAKTNLPRHKAAQREGDQDLLEIQKWWKADIPPKGIDYQYPSGYILPFHFRHPVTGRESTERIQNSKVKGVKPR